VAPDEIRVKSQTYVPRPTTLRVETNLVEIGVVVRDNSGHVVSGLTKENFQIHDDGREREVADFAVDSSAGAEALTRPGGKADAAPAPGAVRRRFIALYFDDVNSKDEQHANDLKQTRESAGRFVKDALQPGVRIGVFTTSGKPELDFTDELQKLSDAVAGVEAHPWLSEKGASVCPAVTPYVAYLIAVLRDKEAVSDVAYQCRVPGQVISRQSDEVTRAQAEETWRRAKALSTETLESIGRVTDHLATMPGTRVLLLASSGFITATLEPQRDRIVSRALHAGVVINGLDSKGLDGWRPVEASVPLTGPPSRVAAGLAHQRLEVVQVGLRVDAMNEPLAALSEGTGGIFFHNNNNLEAGFRELAAPPEITYRLSFRLPEAAAEDSYHKLTVKVVNARYKSVQARPGYYTPQRKAPENSPSRFDQEVVAPDTIEDFPVQMSAGTAKLPSGEMTVSVVANVDISKLNFEMQKDRRRQKIRFVTALMNAEGAIVAAKEATMDLALKEETYNRFAKSGLNAKLTLQVPPGVYKLREVVEETGGKMSCSTNPIEVR
jgi:VWFA-related protein